MGISSLSLPYFVTLISFTKWAKKLWTVIKTPSISRFWLFFLNFHGKAYMDTVRVNIIIINQQNLKVELLHISVGWMGYFFPSIYVFKQSLKSKLKKSRYVFDIVLVISPSANQFSIFLFLPFLLHRFNLKLFYQ